MDWSVFGEALECITRLRATNSTNEKNAILKEYKDNEVVKRMLYYTYNPLLKYKITEKAINKADVRASLVKKCSPFDLCERLAVCNIDNKTRNEVRSYVEIYVPEKFKQLVYGMLFKDLGIRMDAKSINKAIPNLIPTFDVALANPIKKKDSKTGEYKWLKFKANEWISVSLKLNGVRCTNLSGNFHTRTGHSINGMNHIKSDLKLICDYMGWEVSERMFDGELIKKNPNLKTPDDLNFRQTCGIVNSDDRTVEEEYSLEYVIFDTMTIREFSNGESDDVYSVRSKTLKELDEAIESLQLENIRIVPIYYQGAYNKNVIDECLAKTDDIGLEGVMVNRDAVYQAKRSNNLIKVKSWFFNDVKVIDVYEGEGELEGMLGGLIVNYKGYEVRCGSGMNESFREHYWRHSDELIGKIVTVKCKGESQNKNDESLSMQFPIFMGIREDKEEESYES